MVSSQASASLLLHAMRLVEFLDTHVYKHRGADGICRLKTKVFFKPTDTHQLLHKQSFHPAHTFKGIVKSQFIRFKQISSSHADYQQACSSLTKGVTPRGYTPAQLRKEQVTYGIIMTPHRKEINRKQQSKMRQMSLVRLPTLGDAINAILSSAVGSLNLFILY